MNNMIKNQEQPELEVLITFLKRTKEGKYAKIDENMLQHQYARLNYLRQDPIEDVIYYHSINNR
ncbi:hypothetical protein CTH_2309 [Carboxydocella thermautotrophica]|nr:hypothetical protein CTH_2309 [Carboxydocella thermautotrophica]